MSAQEMLEIKVLGVQAALLINGLESRVTAKEWLERYPAISGLLEGKQAEIFARNAETISKLPQPKTMETSVA